MTTKKKMFSHLLTLLGDPRFKEVNYRSVKKHISLFDHLTSAEMRLLVKRNRETTEVIEYRPPNLTTLKPFFESEEVYNELINYSKMSRVTKFRAMISKASTIGVDTSTLRTQEDSDTVAKELESKEGTEDDTVDSEMVPESLTELRRVFVDLVDKAYDEQFANGEVNVRDVNMVITYKTAVEVSRDHVAAGHAINDWKLVREAMAIKGRWAQKLSLCGKKSRLGSLLRSDLLHSTMDFDVDVENTSTKDLIHYAIGYIEAHKKAQRAFKLAFADGRLLTDEETQVLDESMRQISAAEAALNLIEPDEMKTILAHLVCFVLLNKAGEWIGELNELGLLKDQEAEHFLEEIQKDIDGVTNCRGEWIRLECAEEKKKKKEFGFLSRSQRGSTENLSQLEIPSGATTFESLKKQEAELRKLLLMTQEELEMRAAQDEESLLERPDAQSEKVADATPGLIYDA